MKISEKIQAIIDDLEIPFLASDDPQGVQKRIELFGELQRAKVKALKLEDPEFQEPKISKSNYECECEIQ